MLQSECGDLMTAFLIDWQLQTNTLSVDQLGNLYLANSRYDYAGLHRIQQPKLSFRQSIVTVQPIQPLMGIDNDYVRLSHSSPTGKVGSK